MADTAITFILKLKGAAAFARDTDKADDSVGRFAKTMRRGLLPATVMLGGLGAAAKKVGDEASDLNESQNATNVVFGQSSKVISDFATGAAKEAGLSMRQVNELVTPIGASLQNYGFSADQAANNSVALSKRAADMASVFNTSVPEALEAIQSGLRGEADPLEKFGVGLNDAAVRAKAVKMGLAKIPSEVSDNAKQHARLALIMDQTSKFQGDFVRTSGEAANAAKINAAEQENLRAKLGQGVLPVMQMYQAVLSRVTGFVANHATATKVAVGVVAGLAAGVVAVNVVMKVAAAAQAAWTIATKAGTAAQWLFNAAMRANPVVKIVTVVLALGSALVVAYKNSETFRNIANGVFQKVAGAAAVVRNVIQQIIKKVQAAIDAVKDFGSTVKGWLPDAFGGGDPNRMSIAEWNASRAGAQQAQLAQLGVTVPPVNVQVDGKTVAKANAKQVNKAKARAGKK